MSKLITFDEFSAVRAEVMRQKLAVVVAGIREEHTEQISAWTDTINLAIHRMAHSVTLPRSEGFTLSDVPVPVAFCLFYALAVESKFSVFFVAAPAVTLTLFPRVVVPTDYMESYGATGGFPCQKICTRVSRTEPDDVALARVVRMALALKLIEE